MNSRWTRSRGVGLAVAGAMAVISIHLSAQGRGGGQGGGQQGGAQQQGGGRGAAARQTPGLEVLPVQGFDRTKVYVITGAGANVIIQVGDEGVLMVDTGNAESSDKVVAAIRQ